MLDRVTVPGPALYFLLTLAACTVDGSVIDDLPCDCAPGFVCDTARDRCIPEDQGPLGDAGDDAGAMDGGRIDAEAMDAGTVDAGIVDAGVRDVGTIDGSMDAGVMDAGTVLRCRAGAPDDFSERTLNSVRWTTVTDADSTIAVEAGVLHSIIPPGFASVYSFAVGRTRQDLSDCAVTVEMTEASLERGAITFFTARVNNDDGAIDFAVVDGALRATYYVAAALVEAWVATYDPVAHRYLAIGGEAGDLVWHVSRDGLSWTEVARVPARFDTSALEYLFGVGSQTIHGPEFSARFDNFNRAAP